MSLEHLKRKVYSIFTLVNFLFKKSKNKVCIHTYPDFDSSCKSIADYTIKNNIHLIIIKQKNSKVPIWANNKKITIVNKSTSLCFYHYFTSYITIFTHGLYSRATPPKNQISINIWHGMPIKKIGHYLNKNELYIPYSTFLLCTSPFYKEIMEKAFLGFFKKIIISTHPNSYYLINKKQQKGMNKKIICLPTYRNSNHGYITKEGKLISPYINIYDLDLNILDRCLEHHNISLIIKPHPMTETNKTDNFDKRRLKCISIIDEDWLINKNITLYELLSDSDGLITDFSSVSLDYLLIDKPIIFAIADYEEYKLTRGIIFDDFFEENKIPGCLVSNMTELIEVLENIFIKNNDLYKNKRLAMRQKVFADHQSISILKLLKELTS